MNEFIEGFTEESEKRAFMNPGPMSKESPLGMTIPGMTPQGAKLGALGMPTIIQSQMNMSGKKAPMPKATNPKMTSPNPASTPMPPTPTG